MSEKVENYDQQYISAYITANEGITSIDKEYTKAVPSPSKVVVIEINMPSSQALKNFSLKLVKIKARLECGVK